MVYSNKFVVCVLVDGKTQSERKDGIVVVPYGSEYSLRFRNKNNRRAVVKFTIDGEDVAGPGYIVPAHSAVDIHRHFSKDARFKFVSLDSPEAVDYGKNDNSDGSKGVIEAKFYLETEPVKLPWHDHHHHHHHYHNHPNVWPDLNNPYCKPTWLGDSGGGKGSAMRRQCQDRTVGNAEAYSKYDSHSEAMNYCSTSNTPTSAPFFSAPDSSVKIGDGCTVEGNSSGQTFSEQYISLEIDFVALRVVLKGVDAPVACAQSEDYCTGCGAKRRKADRFCGACGHKF